VSLEAAYARVDSSTPTRQDFYLATLLLRRRRPACTPCTASPVADEVVDNPGSSPAVSSTSWNVS